MDTQKVQERTGQLIFNTVELGFAFNNNGKKTFKRNIYVKENEIINYLNTDNGMFMTPYRYPEGTEDINTCLLDGDMYFDFDNEEDFEKVRKDALITVSFLNVVFKIPEKDIQVFYSGSKGIHIVISGELIGIEPCVDLNEIFKAIAQKVNGYTEYKTLDLGIYDRKRMFRIPYTRHEKTGLHKIPISIDELRNAPINNIRLSAGGNMKAMGLYWNKKHYTVIKDTQRAFEKIAENYREAKKNEAKNNSNHGVQRLSFMPPCMENLLKEGASVGTRNISAACLTSAFKMLGKSFDETYSLVDEWNSNNVSPLPTHELNTTVRSVFKSQKTYGCNMFSYVSECKEECRIFKAKKKREEAGDFGKKKAERQNKLKELGII